MSSYPQRVFLQGLEREIFKLVSKGATPEQWAEWLRVPLEHAAAQGNLGVVDKLIGAGADGSAGWKGCNGRSLLHAASVGGNEGVVSSLLRAGAQPDVNVLTSGPPSLSPLYAATESGHEAVARLLAMAGADVNFEHPERDRSALHEAILGGHERLAKELIMCGAGVSARDSDGDTPLHLAVHQGLEGVVSALLLRGADKDALNNDGNSALICACGAVEGVEPRLVLGETLLAAGADVDIRTLDSLSALDWASREGYISLLHALLRSGADVNSVCPNGYSALHRAVLYDQVDAVDALIEAGADIEVKNDAGLTPLCLAAENGKAKSLLALLQQGASVGAQDKYGQTPMHRACSFQPEGLEFVVDLLLRWGADETAVDNDGEAPADALDYVNEGHTCSQDEVERVRLLLARAPADRAWRRRGWLVMLRARASRAADDSSGNSGSTGLGGSNGAGGGTGDGRKMARRDGGIAAARSGQGQASGGTGGFGAERGGGNEVLGGAVDWLVGMEPAGVFRMVLEFL